MFTSSPSRGILPIPNTLLTLHQNFWVKDHRQVYLTGNPVVWWLSSLAVFGYLAMRGLFVLREKRGYRDLYKREWTRLM